MPTISPTNFLSEQFLWNIRIIRIQDSLGSLMQPHSCGMTSKKKTPFFFFATLIPWLGFPPNFHSAFFSPQTALKRFKDFLHTRHSFFMNKSLGALGLNTSSFFLLYPFIHPSPLPCIHPGQNKNSLFKRLPRQCQHIGSTGAEVVQLANPGVATPPSALHNSNLLLNSGQVQCNLVAVPSICHKT